MKGLKAKKMVKMVREGTLIATVDIGLNKQHRVLHYLGREKHQVLQVRQHQGRIREILGI